MEWEQASGIFDELRNLDGAADEPVARLRDDLWLLVASYAELRVRWGLAKDVNERAEIDGARTRAHNALIDGCNILSRTMARAGLSTKWRKKLGDESTREGRKNIGDFASLAHCRLGLAVR